MGPLLRTSKDKERVFRNLPWSKVRSATRAGVSIRDRDNRNIKHFGKAHVRHLQHTDRRICDISVSSADGGV
jgi:hypothetical protein